jgi:hypothetical protein
MQTFIPSTVLLTCLLGILACNNDQDVRVLTPEISVAPNELFFGDQVVPVSNSQQIYLSNSGRVALEVSLSMQAEDSDIFSVAETTFEIQPDETLTLPIDFTPSTYLSYQALLIVDSNDEDTPQLEIPLSGDGVHAPLPDIEITPQSIDFGDIDVGGSAMRFVTVRNIGGADLLLGTLQQEGSGAFEVDSDPGGATIAPGAELPIIISFVPTQAEGDAGTLTLSSNDPDESTADVLLLGNGGGDFGYPEASIDCPEQAAPPQWVELDGSDSSDPEGNTPLSFAWELAGRPLGSQAELTNLVTPFSSLFCDVAGTYEVQLTVTNSLGIPSAPALCSFEAIPEDELHIELTWDTDSADLDLHLLQEDAEFFEEPGDCTYCNPNPKWGADGTGNDPRLDLDDRGGYGPENINLYEPDDGQYRVMVHYFEEHGDDAVTATVRIYSYGILQTSLSRVMQRNELWEVGVVNWPEGTVGILSTELADAPTRNCW